MRTRGEQLSFETYEAELLNPLRGHALTEVEAYIASLLLDADKERPITNERIREKVRLACREDLTERTVKKIVLRLRDAHYFPIMASKERPFGYWWCHSPEEMKEHIERVRREAIGMLATLKKIVDANFPELAGQLRLDMEA